ncbi:hypothetical protein TNCV_1218311 [Trichonephila clavipes]|nr:hypothetical protein TNCV_1218311 [Trichonephila clavipes]
MATPGSSFTPTPLGHEDNLGASLVNSIVLCKFYGWWNSNSVMISNLDSVKTVVLEVILDIIQRSMEPDILS